MLDRAEALLEEASHLRERAAYVRVIAAQISINRERQALFDDASVLEAAAQRLEERAAQAGATLRRPRSP